MPKRTLSTRDIARKYGITARCAQMRARRHGIGKRTPKGYRFTAAEARRVGQMPVKVGPPIRHGLYVGWRDPEQRKRCLARIRKMKAVETGDAAG